jgi:hypothetical protein
LNLSRFTTHAWRVWIPLTSFKVRGMERPLTMVGWEWRVS